MGCYGSYVPTHLHLMVFELVKNSLRAVQEQFMDSDKVAPPVRIIVADGLEDVTIKVGILDMTIWYLVSCIYAILRVGYVLCRYRMKEGE